CWSVLAITGVCSTSTRVVTGVAAGVTCATAATAPRCAATSNADARRGRPRVEGAGVHRLPAVGHPAHTSSRDCQGTTRWNGGADRSALVRPAAEEDGGDGAEDQLDVEPGRPVLGVVEIQLHHLVEGEVTAAVDLPQPGQARGDHEALVVPVLIGGDLGRNLRPRPDHAHLPNQDVE